MSEAIKKQNNKFNFVSNIIKRAGYPVWDKAYIINSSSGRGNGRSASDSSEEVIYIPFVLDSGNTTNAILAVSLGGQDSVYRMTYANQYRSFGFDTTSGGWTARKAFFAFAGFDYAIFGHKEFLVLDSRLFGGPVGVNQAKATLKVVSGQSVNGRSNNEMQCSWAEICWWTLVARTTGVWRCYTYESCWPVGNNYGGSGSTGGWTGSSTGTGDPSGGGGGSTNGWWGSGSGPCVLGPTQTRESNVNPGGCPPGWVPMGTGVGPYFDPVNINGVWYTTTYFPGLNEGLPWKWWENSNFLQPYGGVNFGSWAIDYLSQNPNLPFSTFQNQFLGTLSGRDGDYDTNYWNDPNLTFPPQSLPSWSTFNAAYPKHKDTQYDTPSEMYTAVGGEVLNLFNSNPSAYENTCALRISRALNNSGITIPPGTNRYQGADGKYYFLSAAALLKWMKITFGTPTGTNHLTGAQGGAEGRNFPSLLTGKKGIYIMTPNYPGGCDTPTSVGTGFCASGHADMIQNGVCDNKCYFNARGGVHEIFVWELQ